MSTEIPFKSTAEVITEAILNHHEEIMMNIATTQMSKEPKERSEKMLNLVRSWYKAANKVLNLNTHMIQLPTTGAPVAASFSGLSGGISQSPAQVAPPAAANNQVPPKSVRTMAELGNLYRVSAQQYAACPPGALCGVSFSKKGYTGTFFCNSSATKLNTKTQTYTCSSHGSRSSLDVGTKGATSNPKSSGSISASHIMGVSTPTGLPPANASGLAALMSSTPSSNAFAGQKINAGNSKLNSALMNSVSAQTSQIPVGQNSPAGAQVDLTNLLTQNSSNSMTVNNSSSLLGVPNTPNNTGINHQIQQKSGASILSNYMKNPSGQSGLTGLSGLQTSVSQPTQDDDDDEYDSEFGSDSESDDVEVTPESLQAAMAAATGSATGDLTSQLLAQGDQV